MRLHRDTPLLVLVALALVLNGLGLGWGLPPSEVQSWDPDGIAPLQPLGAAKRMIVDDWWNSGYFHKYPMGHFFVLMAAYAPYLGALWLTGGLANPSDVYPYGFSDPVTALTVLTLIARGVSVLMGVGIVVLVYLTARELAGRRAGFFAALTLALSPAFIFYAHTGNVDTPSVFWSALGLFAFGRLVQARTERRHYVLLGLAVGMAAATKEQAAAMFLLVPLSVLALHARHHGQGAGRIPALLRAAIDRNVLSALGAAVLTFVLATHLVFNWDGNLLRFRWRLSKVHPVYGTDYPGGGLEVGGPLDALGHMVANTWSVMNPALFLAAVAGLVVLTLRHRWARHFAVPLVSYTVVAILVLNFFRARLVMEAALVLAFFAGPVLGDLWARAAARSRALVAALLLLWAYSFAYGFEVDYLLMQDARYAAEAWMETEVAPGAVVEAFGGPTYLPRFPGHVRVRHAEFSVPTVAGLPERSPDFVVLTSGHYRQLRRGSAEEALLARLVGGDFGYRPVRTFRRDPLLSPRLIPTLSPQIIVLANSH